MYVLIYDNNESEKVVLARELYLAIGQDVVALGSRPNCTTEVCNTSAGDHLGTILIGRLELISVVNR